MTKEYRTFAAAADFKADESEGNAKKLAGYFVRYNEAAQAKPYDYYEKIIPGVFKDSLGSSDIRCLYNHNNDFVLGRQSAGTLELEDREDGLFGTVTINEADTDALNVYERVKRGDITGCSFGAWVDEEEMVEDGELTLFEMRRAELIEVSITPFPFYPTTTMEVAADSRSEQIHRRRVEKLKKIFKEKKEC